MSVSAGVAAMYSAFPATYPYRVFIAVALIWIIAWMNLRGVKESGRVFAVPTYGFVVAIIALVIVGFAKAIAGGLDPIHVHHATVAAGAGGSLGIFLLLHAFAGGSTAMTGVEAISNGVPAFKPVEWKNARRVLAWLGVLLAIMFLGISFLAWKLHPIPNTKETVISQITRAIVGTGTLGNLAFFFVQAMTMLILVLAANTSFADFPRLASFHAEDHFLPTPLTKRGRRLVFANGIVVLAAFATLLTVAFGASVTHLIPLYAIGVFTSFTLSQGGMAKRHLTLKEPGWKRGLWVNGLGAVATGIVGIVIAVTKFTHGAWIIMVIVPVTVAILVRVNKHYDHVASKLDEPDPALAIATVEPPGRGRAGVTRRRRSRSRHALRRSSRRRSGAGGARRPRRPQPRRRVLGALRLPPRVRPVAARSGEDGTSAGAGGAGRVREPSVRGGRPGDDRAGAVGSRAPPQRRACA